MDGEAYQTVSGQNSNNSLRIPDSFMRLVERLDENPDATITLLGRTDRRVDREVRVADLWRMFNHAAWRCADPAPQFTDTFNAWHTCPAGEDGDRGARHNRLNSTNPCGEYAFLDDTSCNLASINVLRFLDSDAHFDVEGFRHMVTLCQLVLEASIHHGQFPTQDIARKTWLFRSTGLGLANLAALLMSCGLPYDSDEARAFSAALVGILTGCSYHVSALMAECVGPFAKYDLNREDMMRVIRNHARVAGAVGGDFEQLGYTPLSVDHGLLESLGMKELSDTLAAAWIEAIDSGERFGYRNAQVSVMAPTGTISFAMDCASTSIEPFFSHVVYKKLSGGGFMKLANPVMESGLRNLGYDEGQIADILAYILQEKDGMIADGKIEGAPHLREEHLAVFDTANQCGSGKRYIHYSGHVRMVAALTPLLSGAISKTVNLPREATVEDFMDVHLMAWHLGVKGITLYRDGSKSAQPLNLRLDPERQDVNLADLSYKQLLDFAANARERLAEMDPESPGEVRLSHREKPVGIRSGHTHPAQIDDVKIYTTVNRDGKGQISEIYITTDREGTLIMGLLNSLSKTISVMLQYKIPPQNISKMLRGQKYEPYGFVTRHPYIKYCTSISDLISKIIDIEIGDFSRCQVKPDSPDMGAPIEAAPVFPQPARPRVCHRHPGRTPVERAAAACGGGSRGPGRAAVRRLHLPDLFQHAHGPERHLQGLSGLRDDDRLFVTESPDFDNEAETGAGVNRRPSRCLDSLSGAAVERQRHSISIRALRSARGALGIWISRMPSLNVALIPSDTALSSRSERRRDPNLRSRWM